MIIKPNSIYGYHVKYFVAPILILILGNIALTVFMPEIGWYPLIPAIGLLVAVLWGIYYYASRSVTLTDSAFIDKRGKTTKILNFSDVKEVVYTQRYAFGNNVKPALFIRDTTDTYQISLVAMSWNHKQIRAFYDAIPATLNKHEAERAL